MCGQWKQISCAFLLCLLSALAINAQDKSTKAPAKIIGYTVTLVDGYTFDVDEVSKQGDETWVRKGNIQRQIQEPIKSIKPILEQPKAEAAEAAKPVTTTATVNTTASATKPTGPNPIWIYLVDGAKFRVDQVQEQADGAWYSRQQRLHFPREGTDFPYRIRSPGCARDHPQNCRLDVPEISQLTS